jgi:hypothetical protein
MASVTRASYEIITEGLAKADPRKMLGYEPMSVTGRLEFKAWRRTVESVADSMAKDNARFNRSMFLSACGLSALSLLPGADR